MAETAQLNVSISTELLDRLRAAARDHDVSLRHIVGKLIAEGLERLRPPDEIRLTEPEQLPAGLDPDLVAEHLASALLRTHYSRDDEPDTDPTGENDGPAAVFSRLANRAAGS